MEGEHPQSTAVPDEKDEEEAAGDVDDPFEMLGGMGGEEVYKVTLVRECREEQTIEEEQAEEAQEEEEAAGDCDDPFEMMGGMGAEEVYKVTLMPEKEKEEEAEESKEETNAEEAQAEEEEAAGDCDDPFEMMGGMGAEEVYKVTLMKEKDEAEEAEKSKEETNAEEAQEEEEEAAGDCDDPFEMMGGMGAEEVYKVTLMEEKAEAEEAEESNEETNAEEAQEEEEEAAGDCEDPFEMMGGMGAEEVYKVTLMEEKDEAEEAEESKEQANAEEAQEEEEEADEDEFNPWQNLDTEAGQDSKVTVKNHAEQEEPIDSAVGPQTQHSDESCAGEVQLAHTMEAQPLLTSVGEAHDADRAACPAAPSQSTYTEPTEVPPTSPATECEQKLQAPVSELERILPPRRQFVDQHGEIFEGGAGAGTTQQADASANVELGNPGSADHAAPEPAATAAVQAGAFCEEAAGQETADGHEWSAQDWSRTDNWQQPDWQQPNWNADAATGQGDATTAADWQQSDWHWNDNAATGQGNGPNAADCQQPDWQQPNWNADAAIGQGNDLPGADWQHSDWQHWTDNATTGQGNDPTAADWQQTEWQQSDWNDNAATGQGYVSTEQSTSGPAQQEESYECDRTHAEKEGQKVDDKKAGRLADFDKLDDRREELEAEDHAAETELCCEGDALVSEAHVEEPEQQPAPESSAAAHSEDVKQQPAPESSAAAHAEDVKQQPAVASTAAVHAEDAEQPSDFNPWGDMTSERDPTYDDCQVEAKQHDWQEDWQEDSWNDSSWKGQESDQQWKNGGNSWKDHSSGKHRGEDYSNHDRRGGGHKHRDEHKDWQSNNSHGRQRHDNRQWENAGADHSSAGHRKSDAKGRNDWKKSDGWQEEEWPSKSKHDTRKGADDPWHQGGAQDPWHQGTDDKWSQGAKDQWQQGAEDHWYEDEDHSQKAAEKRVCPDGTVCTFEEFLDWARTAKDWFPDDQAATDFWNKDCHIEESTSKGREPACAEKSWAAERPRKAPSNGVAASWSHQRRPMQGHGKESAASWGQHGQGSAAHHGAASRNSEEAWSGWDNQVKEEAWSGWEDQAASLEQSGNPWEDMTSVSASVADKYTGGGAYAQDTASSSAANADNYTSRGASWQAPANSRSASHADHYSGRGAVPNNGRDPWASADADPWAAAGNKGKRAEPKANRDEDSNPWAKLG